ncbi:hypothetical protein B0H14DRAFT_3780228 [Mycena olivaceomarginata]|nr:hypothetical protein B0H14DRAFT_3780228 [Mycena olivaceomarginata]
MLITVYLQTLTKMLRQPRSLKSATCASIDPPRRSARISCHRVTQVLECRAARASPYCSRWDDGIVLSTSLKPRRSSRPPCVPEMRIDTKIDTHTPSITNELLRSPRPIHASGRKSSILNGIDVHLQPHRSSARGEWLPPRACGIGVFTRRRYMSWFFRFRGSEGGREGRKDCARTDRHSTPCHLHHRAEGDHYPRIYPASVSDLLGAAHLRSLDDCPLHACFWSRIPGWSLAEVDLLLCSARRCEGEAVKDEEVDGGRRDRLPSAPPYDRLRHRGQLLWLGLRVWASLLVFGYHVPRPALFDVVFDVRLHSTIRIYTYSSHPCTYLSRYPVICFVFCLRVLLVPAPAPVPVTLAASMSSAAQQAPAPVLASFGHSNPGVGGYTYPSTAAVSFSQPGARDVD